MRIAFGVVLAACMVAAASGQVVSLERFCDERRKQMTEAKESDQEFSRLRTMKSDLERRLKQAKSEPKTEEAIASRMANLKVELLASEQIAAFDWDAFDRELAPIVRRWVVAAGDTKAKSLFRTVFPILNELDEKKSAYFARSKKAFVENKKPLPPPPWSDEQIRTIAKNRADEELGGWCSASCGSVSDELRGSSCEQPFVMPPETDAVALVRRIRAGREAQAKQRLERTRFAMEIGGLSEEKLTERLAQVNEQIEAAKKTDDGRSWRSGAAIDEVRKGFVEAFAARGVVRETGTLADGSEARCERTEGKGAGRLHYLIHHGGKSYLATIRCACETSDSYLPELGLKKPVAGTSAVLKVRDKFQSIWIMTPSAVIEITRAPGAAPTSAPTPAPASAPAQKPADKPAEDERPKPAGQPVKRSLRPEPPAKEPETLTPQVVEDVVKAVFALDRM